MSHDQDVRLLEAIGRETADLLTQADRLVEALAARAGLDGACFRCLAVLCRQGPLPQSRLAALAGLTAQAAAEIVDRLERQGYAGRRREDSGRRVLVHADRAAHRTRLEPALRDLRESWHPLVRGRFDDLALVAGFLAESRRLTDLVGTMRISPDAFTM
ncbi:MarR family winged helix-turn-helix transcriptional regulator [Sphaerisporangium corydalis]|uniref:MarR family winged helix-turn-helix transcriptional regulator n=1 Tax=Sphaerisporangium corydalis TaxID=1441875 RepID=A0ABV9EHX8_9ACTN|nr:helix-turn-helix domain-containing protein [Sphaerisporangium corydalis]